MKKQYAKLKRITPIGVNKTYDFTVEDSHRILARQEGTKLGLYTSNCWHPDIEDFITIKQNANVLQKFNISVGITDDFINAVINNEDWDLIFPDVEFEKYEDEWNGNINEWKNKKYPVIIYKTIKAKKLWDLIMKSTYTRNEPGVLFTDKINKLNPISYTETITAANPCGEQIMGTGACNLGSINLVKFFDESNQDFNYEKFEKYVETAVRFLDNVNDIANPPLDEYQEAIKNKRRIGLGVMGLGSLHFMMGIPYGSKKSLQLITYIYKVKAETEIFTSAKLGKEKGSFPLFDKDKYFNTYWWKNLSISNTIKKTIENIGEMRNSVISSNQPCGNTGIFAGIVSGGIEPVFMKEYTRWVIVTGYERRKLKENGLEFPNVNKGEWFETKYFKFDKKGDEQILKGSFNGVDYEIDKNRGLVKSVLVEDYGWKWVKENVDDINKDNYPTTTELTVSQHIDPLKIIAHYTGAGNSKTVNLPENYKFDDFKDLYIEAWKNNIKGITTYRANTMAAVLEKKKTKEYQTKLEEMFIESNGGVIKNSVKLPKEYYSKGYIRKDIDSVKWYFNIAFADSNYSKPFAIFVTTNSYEHTEVADKVIEDIENLCREKEISKDIIEKQRTKYSGQSNVDKIARAIGMALRHNIPVIDIVNILEENPDGFSTLLFHMKKLLSKFIKDGTRIVGEECPKCGRRKIVYQEGCKLCTNCGWSKCG